MEVEKRQSENKLWGRGENKLCGKSACEEDTERKIETEIKGRERENKMK